MSVKITLAFTNSSLKGGTLELIRPGKYVVGRASDCDIRLPCTLEFMEVSRHHCVLDIDLPDVRVRDLGSRNGTVVNGKTIGQRRPGEFPGANARAGWHTLEDGDELLLGEVTLRVEISGLMDWQKERESAGHSVAR